jgi:hypothetical protein
MSNYSVIIHTVAQFYDAYFSETRKGLIKPRTKLTHNVFAQNHFYANYYAQGLH